MSAGVMGMVAYMIPVVSVIVVLAGVILGVVRKMSKQLDNIEAILKEKKNEVS